MDDLNQLLSLSGMTVPSVKDDIIELINDIEVKVNTIDEILTPMGLDFCTLIANPELINSLEQNTIIDIIPIDSMDMMPENAEFDIGINKVKPNGENGEIDAYKTIGQANLDTRYVPARSGDNPLTGNKGIEPVTEVKSFKDYLNKLGN